MARFHTLHHYTTVVSDLLKKGQNNQESKQAVLYILVNKNNFALNFTAAL